MNPFGSLLICVAGWMNLNQQAVIEYLQEEIRWLREPSDKKPRFNDAQRTPCLPKPNGLVAEHSTSLRLWSRPIDVVALLTGDSSPGRRSSHTPKLGRPRTVGEIRRFYPAAGSGRTGPGVTLEFKALWPTSGMKLGAAPSPRFCKPPEMNWPPSAEKD